MSRLSVPLLFDGAMGTYYSKKHHKPAWDVDLAVLEEPETIIAIHRDYLQAGAQALKTCTFALPELWLQDQNKAKKQLREAVACAQEAIRRHFESVSEVGMQAETGELCEDSEPLLFADLGPVPDGNDPQRLYSDLIACFLKEGVRNFLLETLPSMDGIESSAKQLKEQAPDSCLIVSFACSTDGLSAKGIAARQLLSEADSVGAIDAVGLNCKCGPGHMLSLVRDLPALNKPLSIMPNAGYPTLTNRSALYQGAPDYFAANMETIYRHGASILGGCCGTEPDHIRALHELLQANRQDSWTDTEQGADSKTNSASSESRPAERVKAEPGILQRNAARNRKSILVELDPPATDRISRFMEGVSRLHEAGADVLTIADNPIGRPRADSSILACKVRRETGMDVLPHMTCRDRNLNAIKALLLGLSMEGVHQVLLVTGDPLPLESRKDVKAVFSMNSRTLASFVSQLEADVCEPFHSYGALDLNARNFDVQLSLAKKKEEAGMEGFLTQPVFSKRALENLHRARRELKGKIYGGIMPIVSYKNACFLKNEISGMDIPDDLAESFRDQTRQACEEISLRFCLSMARAMQNDVDGFYLMTPFQRIELMQKLIRAIRALEENGSQSAASSQDQQRQH